MNKEALLLIDIQNIYFTPGAMLLHKPEDAAKRAAFLLTKFRTEGKNVIHVQHNFAKSSEFYRMVKPLEGEKVIHKEYPSSFLGTDLHEYLQEKGIKKLVVAAMIIGPIGTALLPKGVFGLFERFSTFSAVVFNAVLGI